MIKMNSKKTTLNQTEFCNNQIFFIRNLEEEYILLLLLLYLLFGLVNLKSLAFNFFLVSFGFCGWYSLIWLLKMTDLQKKSKGRSVLTIEKENKIKKIWLWLNT